MQKDKLPLKLNIDNEICEKFFEKDKKTMEKLVILVSNALGEKKSDQKMVKCYATNIDILFEKIKLECYILVAFNKKNNCEKLKKDLSTHKKNLLSCKKKLKNKKIPYKLSISNQKELKETKKFIENRDSLLKKESETKINKLFKIINSNNKFIISKLSKVKDGQIIKDKIQAFFNKFIVKIQKQFIKEGKKMIKVFKNFPFLLEDKYCQELLKKNN